MASPSRKQSATWKAFPPGKFCQTLALAANERRSRLHTNGMGVRQRSPPTRPGSRAPQLDAYYFQKWR